MRQLPYALSALILLGGCASQEYTGQGEYFELYNLNVIERDLSVFKPTQMVSTALSDDTRPVSRLQEPIAKPVPLPSSQPAKNTPIEEKRVKKAMPISDFTVRHGERYQAALSRWIRTEGYPNIAWQMSPSNLEKMDRISEKPLRFQGSLKQALSELSHHLGVTIQLIMDKRMSVAGVYDFEGEALITHVSGDSIKAVTEQVVTHYGLKWDSSNGLSRSWLAPNDYKIGADYYLLTAKEDIETALTIVLEDFPVYSSIVESTGQVIIQEER